jgi:hypothetical protein
MLRIQNFTGAAIRDSSPSLNRRATQGVVGITADRLLVECLTLYG